VLQLRGQKVILSVGGADNTIVVDDNASVTNFVNSTYSLIQDYGFDGIDINFETGMSPTYLAEAIKQLAAKVGEDFILTMAPQTIDFKVNSSGVASGDYYNLIAEVKDLITIVNLQLYNSGTQYGLDGNVYTQGTVDFATALITILIEKGLDQSQVGIGSNYSSSSGGYMTPSNFVSAYNSLRNGGITIGGTYTIPHAYSNLGGFMIWSINGDASLGNVFSSTYHDTLPDA
jgi:chitinase